MTTTGKSAYFFDNIIINDYLSFDLGYRYDNIGYKPHYISGSTPKLPDDIVKGLYIPLPKGPEISWNPGHYYDPTEEQIKQNAIDNINYIASQKKKYKAHSYSFVSTIDPTNYLRLQLDTLKVLEHQLQMKCISLLNIQILLFCQILI